jgi:hypothetical protein
MNYFEIHDDVDAEKRWYLGDLNICEGKEIDTRKFTVGKMYRGSKNLCVEIYRKGRALDFSFAVFDMPVVRKEVGELIQHHAPDSIQLVPCRVGSQAADYVILNVLRMLDCIDDSKSEYIKWTSADHRSDLAGQYRTVTRLVIDPDRAAGEKIFRLAGWEMPIIVGQEIRDALESRHVSGIFFEGV